MKSSKSNKEGHIGDHHDYHNLSADKVDVDTLHDPNACHHQHAQLSIPQIACGVLAIAFLGVESFMVQFSSASPYALLNQTQACDYTEYLNPGFEQQRDSVWGLAVIALGVLGQSVLIGHEYRHLDELSGEGETRDWYYYALFFLIGIAYAAPTFVTVNCGLLLSYNVIAAPAAAAALVSFSFAGVFFTPLIYTLIKKGLLAAAPFMGFSSQNEPQPQKFSGQVFAAIFMMLYIPTIAGMYSLTAAAGVKTLPEKIFTASFSAASNVAETLWHASHWAVAYDRWPDFKQRFSRASCCMKLCILLTAASHAIPAGMGLKRALVEGEVLITLTAVAIFFEAMSAVPEALMHLEEKSVENDDKESSPSGSGDCSC